MNIGRPSDPFGDRTEALADARENRSDFAWQGDGFWFHSTGVTVEDNVVSGSTGHAFVYWSEGLIENNLGIAKGNIDTHVPAAEFPLLNAELKSWKQQHPYWNFDIWYIKCRPFRNNVAYNMARGVHGYYVMTTFHEATDSIDPDDRLEFNLMPPQYRASNKLILENTTLWGMRRVGMGFTHCAQLVIKDSKIYGHGTSTAIAPWTSPPNQYTQYIEVEPAVLGMDLDHYHNERNWLIENNVVQGFDGNAVAMALPANAFVEVNGGSFNNGGADIKIREVNWIKNWGERVVSFDDNNMDPLPIDKNTPWRKIDIKGNIQFGNPNNNIVLAPQFHLTNPAQDAFGILDGSIKMPGYFLLPDDIRLNFGWFNNAKVYFNDQDANFIPATQATKRPLGMDPNDLFPEDITPDKYLDKTNQQLMNQYGTSFGGEILPSTAIAHPHIVGGKVDGSAISLREGSKVNQNCVEVFPNPAESFLNIGNEGFVSVQIISSNGKILKEIQNKEAPFRIDLSVYEAGIYYLRMLDEENKLCVSKIIKRN